MSAWDVWKRALASPTARKVLLVTINFGGVELNPLRHPARDSLALRAATHSDVHIDGYPFWPLLAEWPAITHELSVEDHRATIPETTVSLVSVAPYPDNALTGYDVLGFGRIDLWTDGITDLDDVIPLVAGPTVIQKKAESGAMTASISDAHLNADEQTANGALFERDEFPDLPEEVAGRVYRRTLIGGLQRWFCTQVGPLEYYVCEPPLSVLPDYVEIGGERLDPNRDPMPVVKNDGKTARTGSKYTRVVFPRPVDQYNRRSTTVSIFGGSGIVDNHPLIDLVETVGGYELTPDAKVLLSGSTQHIDVWMTAAGNVWQIAAERIAPQLGIALTWQRGKVHAYDLAPPAMTGKWTDGIEVWDAQLADPATTNHERIANVFAAVYGRDELATELPAGVIKPWGTTVRREPGNGSAIERMLWMSQAQFGRRRYSDAPIQCLDILDQSSVERYLDTLAQIHANLHRRYVLRANWLPGIEANVNQGRELTVSRLGLSNEKVRLVKRVIYPSGPMYIAETIDA